MIFGRTAVVLLAIGCADTGTGGWEGAPAPAEPGTPIGDPVTVRVDEDGGTLASDDGLFRLVVPPDALAEETELTLQPITNTAWGGLGDGYRVSPALSFAVPVQIVFGYTDDDLLGTAAEALGIASQDSDGYWTGAGDGSTDTDARTLTLETADLGAPVSLGRGGPGSADFARHWRIRLEPAEATVKIGGVRKLDLTVCSATEIFDDWGSSEIVLGPPGPYTHPRPVEWSVSGVPAGTVTGDSRGATYRAPTTPAASGRTNNVSAVLDNGGTALRLQSTIRIEGETTWVGTTDVSGPEYRYTTEVTWTLDRTDGTEQWFVPTGDVALTLDTGSCTAAPLGADVVPTDGLLIVDRSTDPPTYSGYGTTVWALTLTCPDAPTVNLPFPAPWFGDAEDLLLTLGTVQTEAETEVIRDSHEIEDATISWRFESL